MCVEQEQAKSLTADQKKFGKGTTCRKLLKDQLGEKPDVISRCEATILPKFQDPKTKKISDDDFLKKVLPEVAADKCKCKVGDPKAEGELKKMKDKLAAKAKQEKPKEKKVDAATARLTDTSKYTGSHKERFDGEGKGKGKTGRVEEKDASGYVGNYKGAGTYDKK